MKKSAHMFVYAVLYYLVVKAFGKVTYKTLLLSFVICVVYAMSDEYHQSFVPGRTAKVTDIGFDSLGMSIAYLRIRGFV